MSGGDSCPKKLSGWQTAPTLMLPEMASGQDFTGERYLPSLTGEIELEHLHRYLMAAVHCSGKAVLDIACGKGSTAFYLAEKYGCSVVGIDISEELIQEAEDTCRKKGLNNKVRFEVGNAMDLPFDDNEFDVAISQGILVFVDDKTKTINEASRVLKDGGKAG